MGRDSARRSSTTSSKRSSKRSESASTTDVRARPVPEVSKLLSTFKRLAEMERKEDKREARSTPASSTASESDDRILRSAVLRKQGGRVKSWHSRFFVLRRSGLYYYRDELAFRAGTPLGRIRFCDMISISCNDRVAESVPAGIHKLIGLRYVFVVHTELRTYTIAASSEHEQAQWVADVNKTHEKFQLQFKRKNALLGEVWRLGGDKDIFAAAQELTKTDTDVDDVVENMTQIVYNQFAEDVGQLFMEKTMVKTFMAWKAYTRFCQRARQDQEAEKYHKSFFSKSRRSIAQRISRRLGVSSE